MTFARSRTRRLAAASSLVLLLSMIVPGATVQAATPGAIEVGWERAIPTEIGLAAIHVITSIGSDVIVAGQISGQVPGGSDAGSVDVWVARFTGQGDLVWITQFGTNTVDHVTSIVANDSSVYIGGWTLGTFENAAFDSQRDFVARLSSNGAFQWAHESEQSTTTNGARVALGLGGDVVVALTDHTSGPDGYGYIGSVRRYRPDGSLLWKRDVTACCGWTQPLAEVVPYDFAADAGGMTLTGFSIGSVVPTSLPGATGGFVRRYGYDGSTRWTSYIGVSEIWGPVASRITSSEAGIWASGTSAHPITGEPDQWPDPNPFVRRYVDTGTIAWTKAITASNSTRDCASILVTGAIPPAADPAHGPGAFVARVHADGTSEWRFELVPEPEHLVVFLGVARTSDRVFVGIERENSQYTVAALSGVPIRGDCDGQSPVVSSPAARFVTGTTFTSTVPVRVSSAATDAGSGLAGFDVLEQLDGAAWRTIAERRPAAWADLPVRVGHRYRFAIRAVDRAYRSMLAMGPSAVLVRREDTSAQVVYRGRWRTIADGRSSGGTTHASSTAGASATVTFTGRAFAWVAPVSGVRGSARVYIDGGYAGTVNLSAASFTPRRVVFTRSWATAGRHSVRIVVVGTAGHPRVDIDTFLTLE